MSVTFPTGFLAGGVTAGVKPSGRPDLGLLVADDGCAVAGLFTTNAFPAAPVVLTRERVAGGHARAVLVNSGQANAATGARGEEDARITTGEAAKLLDLAADEVLACSTGVIGERVPSERLLDALPGLVGSLSADGGGAFAEAIMTTDTRRKQAQAEVGGHRVGGCAKGVGMIAPNLATMLVFVTTDAAVAPEDLRRLAHGVLEPAFESLTVDASTSTNDTVLLFASGAAGRGPVSPASADWASLEEAVGSVAGSLLDQLAGDAEGVTHVLVVEVEGAASDGDARRVAKEVAESPLVKTAAFGGDPNPGRLLQAVGQSGVAFDPGAVSIRIGEHTVVRDGTIPDVYFDGALHDEAQAAMQGPRYTITVALGDGPGRGRAIGCDLSYEYVRINAEYTT